MSKKTNKTSEYFPERGMSIIFLVIAFGLSILFVSELLESNSIVYYVLLFCSSIVFASLLYIIILNQRVIIKDNKITLLYGIRPSLTGDIADVLYQIVIKKDQIAHLRFSFENGKKNARISPQVYKDGDKLLAQLKIIIKRKKMTIEIIEM